MTTLAIELNDAELRVAGPDGVLAVEPGCALLAEGALVLGHEAERAARLLPRQLHDRFWMELGPELLPHPHPQAATIADLAFAQLDALWKAFGEPGADVVFVLPGSYSPGQLGLLLGIAQACGIRASGLVDAAVATTRGRRPEGALLHLDAGRHASVLTRLKQDTRVSRDDVTTIGAVGLSSLFERWLDSIARTFLTQARFDPLHDAEAEQALYDALPSCLEALREREGTRLEIELRGTTFAADLERDVLRSAVQDLYDVLVEAVERAAPRGDPFVLQVHPRLARLPGLLEALSAIEGSVPVDVDSDAACAGALARSDDIRRPEGDLRFVRELPVEAEDSDGP